MPEILPPHLRLLFHGFLHEIRNPMSAVLTASALLRDPVMLDEENLASLLEVVDGETRYMNRIINEFDHYLHLQKPVMEPFDLTATVRGALASLREEMTLDGSVEVVDELPPEQQALGDGNQIDEAVRAVLRNAIQALEGSAQTPPALRLTLESDASKLSLSIHDNGEGFIGESAKRAFEPFYSTRSGACGLGLPLAQAILRNHQGNVEIVPQKRRPGACLRLVFPQ